VPTLPAILETRDSTGRGLRVEFFRRGDRYAHVISLLDGEAVTPAWESVEGTDAHDWPPSPALQQISLETLAGGRRALLLVGMAGTSHWSLSVEATQGALLFDAACRVKQVPEWLGNHYESRTPASGLLKWVVADDSELAAGPEHVTIQPASATLDLPATARWTYRVTLAASH
jgi:hypothetical protein